MHGRHRLARRVLPACLVAALLIALAAADRVPARVVAVGDVHGAYAEFVALLQGVRLVDGNRRWIGGSATLVQTGDVIDRGARSRECLDLVMDLERRATKQGGRVIPLLGNHEVMNVMGDLRYVTPQIYRTFASPGSERKRERAFRDFVAFLAKHEGHSHTMVPPPDAAARTKWMEEHPPGFVEYRDAFGPGGTYGRWIRTHHAVVRVGDGVFVHGGLDPALEFANVDELDDRIRRELVAFDSTWRTLVDQEVVWRHMKLAEAVKFVGEELKWLKEGGKGASQVEPAMQALLGYKSLAAAASAGPLWFRGLAEESEDKLVDGLTAMLARQQARYLVSGHTVVSKTDISARFGNRVLLIDTGMLKESYGGRASALEIQDDRFTALYADTEPVNIRASREQPQGARSTVMPAANGRPCP